MNQEEWNELALSLGFGNECEMLSYMYKDHSMLAIAEILGFAESTIFYRIKRHNIKTRPRGCLNPNFKGKRGNPLSQGSIEAIQRQHRLMHEDNWAELGRRCSVNEGTAKKYAMLGSSAGV